MFRRGTIAPIKITKPKERRCHITRNTVNSSTVPLYDNEILPTSMRVVNYKEIVSPLFENPRKEGHKYSDVWQRARQKLRARTMHETSTSNTKSFGLRKTATASRFAKKNTHLLQLVTPDKRSGVPCGILHPNGRFKGVWSIVVAFLLLYTVIVMPFSMAFVYSTGHDAWFFIDISIDLLFFIDVLVNCTSAFYDQQGILCKSRKQILAKYARTWLFIDLIACFPFALIDANSKQEGSASSDTNSLLRLLRIPRLYRLLRVTRLLKMIKHYRSSEIIDRIQDFLSLKQSFMRLLSSFATIMILVHIMSCFWFFFARLERFHPDTWISRANYIDSDTTTQYIASVYWTITTITTVGYGDISALTNTEKLVSCSWMIFGLYFFSFTIGSLTSIVTSMDTKERMLVTKLTTIDEFFSEADLSKELKSRLKHAIRYSTEKRGNSFTDKQNILSELPKQLRYEVAINMYQGAAKRIPFFSRADDVIASFIVPLLQPLYFSKEQYVYYTGEYADEIYFLVRGKILYELNPDEIVVKEISAGDYFGDIEVVKQIPRKLSTKVNRTSELLIMNRQLIQMTQYEFPKLWDEMKETAWKSDISMDRIVVETLVMDKFKPADANGTISVRDLKETIDKKMAKMHPELCPPKEKNHSIDDLWRAIEELTKLVESK